jgi:putative ABC transport system substrate-binding protein
MPFDQLKRRNFLTLLGGGAAWPLVARAQQGAMPVVGFLDIAPPNAQVLAAFVKGLGEMGFVEGQNVAIESRYAQGDVSRLTDLAADLIRRPVAVIATLGGVASVRAVRATSTTLPIVFEAGADPVQSGLVASLNRPGGNTTGVYGLSPELDPKRLGLLHQVLPKATRFAALLAPARGDAVVESRRGELQTAAATIGAQIEMFFADNPGEIDSAFAAIARQHVDALLVGTSRLFAGRVAQLVTLAARYMLPAMYFDRDFPVSGGLMSYATIYLDQIRQVGVYVGRILKGEKPTDLPVWRPTKFEFVLNLQTAKLLGIQVPPTLVALADEVIE